MSAYGVEVEDALQKRRDWLVSKDLGVIQSSGEFALQENALRKLREMEIYRAGEKLSSRTGLPFSDRQVRLNSPMTYKGYVELESGTWAVVTDSNQVQMTRVKNIPEIKVNSFVVFEQLEKGFMEIRELQMQQQASKSHELSQAEIARRELDRDEEQELER